MEVHGITNEFLADKPEFNAIAGEFLAFIDDAELIIHNAPFDVGFIDHEVKLNGLGWGAVADHCSVIDTLVMARKLHPGRRNNLDALCDRYFIDNSQRELHGALLDAEILADVYLAMTGGQTKLSLGGADAGEQGSEQAEAIRRLAADRPRLAVVRASDTDLERHRKKLEAMAESRGQMTLWQELEQ